MSEIAFLLRAVFYIAKIARLGIIIGIFDAIERCIFWSLKPLKVEKRPTRLERVSK